MKQIQALVLMGAGLLVLNTQTAFSETQNTTASDTSQLEVRSVTVFKDGHAFVVQEGKVPVNASGDVLFEQIPNAVMGTFWTYSPNTNTRIASVTAGQRIVDIEHTALNLRELIEANPNTQVTIEETNSKHYEGIIEGFLTRSTEELIATSVPGTLPPLSQKSDQLFIKTLSGTFILPIDRVASVIFKDNPKHKLRQPEYRNFLRAHIESATKHPASEAEVGLTYVQKGIRWIPSYQIDLDDNSNAVIRLQATVVNELIDLTNVTMNLVVGVPSFPLANLADPMGLQQDANQLSHFFQSQSASAQPFWNNRANFANNANAFVSQVASQQLAPTAANNPDSTQNNLTDGIKNEDLYVFTLRNVTLKKNERIVLPISVQTIPYHDVFALTIPIAPPSEIGRSFSNDQQLEMFRLMNSPKVKHKIRLSNNGTQPFTTAPAMVFRNGKLLSQGIMTYAAPGAASDVTLTDAIDIQVKKTDSEVGRTPNALTINDNHYTRADIKGEIRLTNRRNKATEIEVIRNVVGTIDSADHDGKKTGLNWFESRESFSTSFDSAYPWWNSYSFPWWWSQVNGIGKVQWNIHLDKDESIVLENAWHYFWL
jgi:hypothetical protein